jgi:hypothetical protein
VSIVGHVDAQQALDHGVGGADLAAGQARALVAAAQVDEPALDPVGVGGGQAGEDLGDRLYRPPVQLGGAQAARQVVDVGLRQGHALPSLSGSDAPHYT